MIGIRIISFIITSIIIVSVILVGALTFWAVNEIYLLIETSNSGIELIADLRKVQANTFTLLVTENLDISYLWWVDSVKKYRDSLERFNRSPRLELLLQDASIHSEYKAFQILSKRALASTERIMSGFGDLRKNGNVANLGFFLQPSLAANAEIKSFALLCRETGAYFSKSYENTILPLISSLTGESEQIQTQIIVLFLGITGCIIVLSVIFSILLRREEGRRKSELLRMEAEINKLESLGIFAGGIAHDFNNYLTSIIGNLGLARQGINAGSELHEIVSDAQAAASKAASVAAQFLTFTKGDALVLSVKNMASIITYTSNFVVRGTKVKCTHAIADDLWNVEIDEDKMCKVLNNIFLNSVQAMPKGGVIEIHADNEVLKRRNRAHLHPGRYLHISIKDSGGGIPHHIKSKVFDPFFTTKKTGSGLGLAVSYSIIKKHNGSIFFESEADKGTVFHIYLKASDKTIEAAPVEIRVEEHQGEGRILLMDDVPEVRKISARLLEHLGYTPVTAADGKEAIEIFKKALAENKPFKAVILDVTVPGGVGGMETIKELRRIDPNVKAIVSSGYADDPVMSRYTEYGFKGVLKKAYTMDEMENAINKVLGSG